MILMSNLKTLRLTTGELQEINKFIQSHPFIRHFSTLVRASLWEYMQNHKDVVNKAIDDNPPRFLWEYDLRPEQIHKIISGSQKQRLWLVGKILEHGTWDEIWQYLDLNVIESDLPRLRLAPKTRKHWERAMQLWKKTA